MRLILTILLIGLFKADAQMVINASAPYRPLVSANLLLDDYPNSRGAYSLRKINKQYTGNCIRVRRDSIGQNESDIGFTTSGDLDTITLKNFIRNNSAFLVYWYDQSGNNDTASSITQSEQPRIMLNGSIDRTNNKPSIFFDGNNDYLDVKNLSDSITGEDKPFSIISVVRKTNTTSTGVILGLGSLNTANPLIAMSFLGTGNDYSIQIRDNNLGNTQFAAGNYAANTQYLASIYSTGLALEYFSNNTSQINNTYNRQTLTLNRGSIGSLRRTTNVSFWGGHIQELILYASDKKSDRTEIETNINTYYSIY